MLETVQGWAAWLWPYLVIAWPWVKAIVIGYGASIGLTQIFKFYLPGEITDESHKRRTRLMAAGFAFPFLWLMWPETVPPWEAGIWALVLAVLCPIVVKAGLLILYKRYPELEGRLSARPK